MHHHPLPREKKGNHHLIRAGCQPYASQPGQLDQIESDSLLMDNGKKEIKTTTMTTASFFSAPWPWMATAIPTAATPGMAAAAAAAAASFSLQP